MKPLVHLLKPKEFRVWCRPDSTPGDLTVTSKPSKVTCANCLTVFRSKTQNRHKPFAVSHTGRDMEADPWSEWKTDSATEETDDL